MAIYRRMGSDSNFQQLIGTSLGNSEGFELRILGYVGIWYSIFDKFYQNSLYSQRHYNPFLFHHRSKTFW